jgi:hypothetical protein
MRDGDDGGLADGLMRDQGGFEVHGTDHSPPDLMKVFEAVGELDVAPVVDGDDVSCLEPAVGGPLLRLLAAEVAGGDPGAADVQFAGGTC